MKPTFPARSALLILLAVAVVITCSDEKKPAPGKPCLMNSDCMNPLSCSFGKCHETCREARDCAVGQRCVRGPGGNVCILMEEESCAFNSMCPAPLVCGRDLKCRNQCLNARDCATVTQQCVLPDKVCAEPEELVSGALVGAAGDGGVTDAPVDRAPVEAGPNPCGISEAEPNEDRRSATPYAPGTDVVACLASRDDVDFYEMTVPATDSAGGYFQGSITDVGNATVDVRVFSGADDAAVLGSTYTTERGASLHFYWAGAPGQVYRVSVNRWVGSELSRYTFRAVYTKIEDPGEPNDTREAAKPLTLGMPATGYFFSGFRGKEIAEAEYHDWYSADLAPGMLTVRLEDVPINIQARVELLDAAGTVVKRESASNAGAQVVASFPVTAPGSYRLVIWPALLPDASGKGMSLPDSFRRAYRLTASQ